jgi:AraC-like DNA-binding protein
VARSLDALRRGPSPTTITCAAPSVLHVNPQPLLSALSGLYFEATGDADIDVMTHWVHLIHTNVVRLNEAWDDRNATWHIWEKVAADLGHPWTVAELAGMACMSGESFRLWCRRSNGRSPLEHVTFLRMRRATDVLRRTDQKLEVIARWLGYENVFAFSRAFKRWIGMPPAHFRNAATSRHALQHPGAAKPGGESRP